MKPVKFILGLLLGVVIFMLPIGQVQPASLSSVQNISVQLEGRKKPLDTVARETVMQIYGKGSYKTVEGEKLDYLDTYLSLWFNTRDWNEEPLILFNYRPLKTQLGLDVEQKYFSFGELMRSPLGSIILDAKEKQAAEVDLTRNEKEALTIEERLALTIATVGSDRLPLVPHPTDIKGKWLDLDSATEYYSDSAVKIIQQDYSQLQQAYRQQSPDLELAADKLRQDLASLSPSIYPTLATSQREVSFYGSHYFAKASILYGLGFITILVTIAIATWELYWSGVGIFSAGLITHGFGFVERMQIAGRPPVTNMYESVIWVSFGIIAIALLFELIHQAKYYFAAAAPLAILCLVLADSLPAVLDPTISPLVPVLRDNFWLSVHVPTIALSYAGFALAYGLGHIILGHYLLAPQAKAKIRSLSKWNYGVLQAGVLLLTTGIILGGIWAHFSWGRFWGWDPKETWALIALMCYVVPLHGRLVGWLADFGMAVTSVVSFNAVLMAWYGVNFVLGTGLHSYGFADGGSELVVASFVGFDLLLVLLVAAKHQKWFQVKDKVIAKVISDSKAA
ncbi:MAG: cytochrome c biogenesis protein CcsA [Cyanobacteria bacterium P01_G01_bin.19]